MLKKYFHRFFSKKVDYLISDISADQLLIVYLCGLLAIAVVLAIFTRLKFNPFYILYTALLLVVSCCIINAGFCKFLNLKNRITPSVITGLILSLVITPDPTVLGLLYFSLFLISVAAFATASKYIITIGKSHIFNPAVIGIALMSAGSVPNISWWVGVDVMTPFVVLGGLLIARKIQSGQMLTCFVAYAVTTTSILAYFFQDSIFSSIKDLIFSTGLLFVAFVLMTDPATSPIKQRHKLIFAVIAGVLVSPELHISSYYSSPVIAILAGNVYSFIANFTTKKKTENLLNA